MGMRLIEAVEGRRLLSQTWIVATNGLDTNPGTLNAPLRTIQAAANLAQPGDTVMIEGGTYHETVTPPRSGTASAPITFEAYNSQQVVISGADPVAGWTQYNDSIYSANQAWDLGEGNNQVFVDGQMIGQASFPNTSLNPSQPSWSTVASATVSAPPNGYLYPAVATIYDPSLIAPAGYWNGATIHIGNGQGWVIQTGTVLSSAPGSLTIAWEEQTSSELPTSGNHYYLTDSFKALSGAGEWYRDPTTGQLYLWTPTGDSPANHDIEVKHRQFAFELSNRSYINLQNLSIFSASIDTNSASNSITINNIYAEYVSQQMLSPFPWDSHSNQATTGIQLNGTNDVIENSTIAYSSGDGVYLGGTNDTAQNNIIHDTDYSGTDSAGIEANGTQQQILSNTIYYAGRSGITDSDSTQDTIEYNTIHDVGLQTTDLGGIYDYGTNSQGTVIAYNTIYNIQIGGFGGCGLYLDGGSENYIVHDNDVYNVDHPLKINSPATGNVVYNNTLIGGTNNVGNETTPASGTGQGVTDLGTFGGFESIANAINSSGEIVGSATTAATTDAYSNSNGNLTDLGQIGGTFSVATAVNNAGTIVGAAYPTTGPRHAFLDASGNLTDLGTLPGDAGSEAFGINNSGQVVGVSFNLRGLGRAFSGANGTMSPVPTLGGSVNEAFAINDSGWIVGASSLAGDQEVDAFVDRNGVLTDLGTLGGTGSYAMAINNAGVVVGQSYTAGNGNIHAFVWSNGVLQDLGTLPGLPNTVATGINNNGDIVGYAYNPATYDQRAFIYHDGVMYDLNNYVNNNGWIFYSADAINDAGQIVGTGYNPAGFIHGFTVAGPTAGTAASLFGTLAPAPSAQNVGDPSIPASGGVELGVQFESTVPGYIDGVQFWKGTGNTSTHTGELWSATGQLLATATFSNETGSGWQQVTFSSPVAISAYTPYTVSYHTTVAVISYSPGTFASSPYGNAPLYALQNNGGSGNGVYAYGASSFPTQFNGQAPNYWVDAVFSTTPTVPPSPPSPPNPPSPPPPTADSIWSAASVPAAGGQNVSDPTIASQGGVELGVKFTSDVAGTITGIRFWKGSQNTGAHTGELWSSTGQLLATAMFTGESSSGWQQVVFSTPIAITPNTTYVASYHTAATSIAYSPGTFSAGVDAPPLHALASGASGGDGVYVYGASSFPTNTNGQAPNYWVDVAFAPSASVSTIFGSAAPISGQQNVYDPAITSSAGVELGLKFQSSVAGQITGVRFYKGSLDTGVQTGELWTSTGQLLATATFTNETASGWQQVNFSAPVTISANTTYIVSYHTTSAYIAYTPGALSSGGINTPPLTALQSGQAAGGNSLYTYGGSAFPTFFNGQSANYWVDVVFSS
jgi:probable HAF family extracellular repeat protein